MNRSSIINAAAWVAVLTVVIGKLLLSGFEILCDRVLPLISILLTHAVLAWEDYQVGRTEYGYLTEVKPIKRTTARGFK